MTKPWIVLVGGFLGSGKTTLILAAARELEQRGLRSAMVWNDQGNDLVNEWAINGYPQIFVLDHKGVIRWRNAGALNPQGCAELDRLIDELVADCERETKTAAPR